MGVDVLNMDRLLFLLLVCLFLGCTSSDKKNLKLELVSKGIIEIPVDEETSTAWWTVQYLDLGEDEFLIFHDRVKSRVKKIHFAEINEPRKSFDVNVSMEGPNGVGRMDSFYVKSLDSIFVLNQYAYRLYLIDSSGTLKDKYSLIGDNKEDSTEITYLPAPLPNSEIVNFGDKLLLPGRPDVNPREGYNYSTFKTGILLDLKTKKFSYELDYPESYLNSGFWGALLEMPSTFINNKDSILVRSFPIEDKVMVYDFNLNLLNSPSLFKEYYEGKFHSLPEPNLEPDIFYPHIFSNPTNKSILFDPYRDLYYRIYSGPYSEASIEKRRAVNFMQSVEDDEFPDRKIMVFDREFNELGVMDLDKNKYWVDHIKVVKEGILVTVKSDFEDKKVFEIFEVKY